MDWLGEGAGGCGLAWAREAAKRGSVWGPSQAGPGEEPPRGGPQGLWHPGLWHIPPVSVVQGAAGGEAADVAVGAELAGAVWDGVGGVAVHELGEEQEVGGVEEPAAGVRAEARAGCLESRRLGSPGTPPGATASGR